MRTALLALHEALRAYVMRVVAHVDEDDANTAKRARRLLKALTDWERPTAGRRRAKKPAPDAPTPA